MAEIPSDEEMIENEEEEDPEEEEDGMIGIQEQGAEEIEEEEDPEEDEDERPTPSRSFTEEYWESKLKLVKIRKEELNKLVMNFLVAEGLLEVAQNFQNESGTKPEVEFARIKDRMDIVKAIQSGNLNDAVEKLTVLKPEILKTNFLLNQQRLIEIIRRGAKDEAIEFAEKELKPFGEEHEEYLKELEKTLTLLSYKDVPTYPMRELLSNYQRFKTAEDVKTAILTSQTGEKCSKIQYLWRTLIWAQHELSEDSAEYPCMNVKPEKIEVRYHKNL